MNDMDEGERIRIPVEELHAPAYGPDRADNIARAGEGAVDTPARDARKEYDDLIRQLLGGGSKDETEKVEEAPLPATLEELEAAGKIAPIRRYEESMADYEERRAAALAEAQAAPPQPVESGPTAYLPVGGDAVDLETAQRLGLIPAEEVELELADTPEEAEVVIRPGPQDVTVDRKLFDALKEVFDSIEAIPVEGSQLTIEEFNEAMDRQARARERVRELLRG